VSGYLQHLVVFYVYRQGAESFHLDIYTPRIQQLRTNPCSVQDGGTQGKAHLLYEREPPLFFSDREPWLHGCWREEPPGESTVLSNLVNSAAMERTKHSIFFFFLKKNFFFEQLTSLRGLCFEQCRLVTLLSWPIQCCSDTGIL
jgi:hypothetical protein